MQRLLIDKKNLENTTIETQTLSIDEGEILLSIDSFGLSANNITYAVLGDAFGYWGFFPSEQPDNFGVVPVWGFATISESKADGVEVGKRVYGYFPFASHLVARPSKVSSNGFSDVHPQRKSISPVYDQYVFCDTDPGYSADAESWQITFRPLFMTAFVLADFVVSEHENASTIVLTSASSKTAFGTAMLLKQQHPNANIVGLTSAKNQDFVQALGCYDSVLTYAELAQLDTQASTVILDFAGNKETLVNLQSHLDPNKTSTLLIGATDVQGRNNETEKHASGDVFFAPSQVKLRQQEWGPATFFTKYQSGWEYFIHHIQAHIKEVHVSGFDNMAHQYVSALGGNISPQEMLILKP